MAKAPVLCPVCNSADWECIHEEKKSTGLTNDFDRRSFKVPVGLSVKKRTIYRCRRCGYSRSYDN